MYIVNKPTQPPLGLPTNLTIYDTIKEAKKSIDYYPRNNQAKNTIFKVTFTPIEEITRTVTTITKKLS
jgi:hypothetical protein